MRKAKIICTLGPSSDTPQVIEGLIRAGMNVARASRELDALRRRPEWHGLRAVKAGRVVLMDGERHFSAPGPQLARGVELLAEVLAGAEPSRASDGCRISGTK